MDCHFIVSIDTDISEQEPKLTSNTKLDTTACLEAWYRWDRILQTSLEGKALCRFITFSLSTTIKASFIRIPTKRIRMGLGGGNHQEVMILSFKSCESMLFSNLFQRDSSVLLEDKQKGSGTFWRNMVILEPFECRAAHTPFQCRRFEVNQNPVPEDMPVLLKSGQSSSREEAVGEMHDCRSMKQHCH
ncbi:hypothetical protein F2Q69_00012776 [Brassica cretica]|uniref:Uncharacterized protein n=1 Tax=Brassica cretica TaxID=69181 RepID=A0A8S9R084_BRACR|nr:hypothetical protein F2Q69_00012776 [Brassica cretica]